ncbi:MAG: MAPEG family protein [Pseudomonadota bacterium]
MPDTLTPPVFSALLAGVLISLQSVLMLTVGISRSGAGKGVGVDGDMKLERLVRRHGNLAENAAIFLVVLALYELLNGADLFALIVGVLFISARMLHVIGFSSDAGSHLVDIAGGRRLYVLMRASGAGLTALCSIALGLTLAISVTMTY